MFSAGYGDRGAVSVRLVGPVCPRRPVVRARSMTKKEILAQEAQSNSPKLEAVHAEPILQTVKVAMRGLQQPEKAASEFEDLLPSAAFLTALDADVSGIDQPMLSWRGLDDLCAIDIDRPDSSTV